MISRRSFVLGGAAAPAVLAQRRRRPNVLFVLADEWRAQATRYNGDTNVETPALDRLAAESVRYDMAVSGTPVCCPYRASLLTGQYPLTHGVIVNDVELKPKGVTMGEAFTKAGYRTGWIGKWHVYGSPDGQYGRRLAYIPPEKRFGFDYWKACECTHDYNKSLYYEGKDQTPKYWPGYDAFAQTDDACSFIRQQSPTRSAWCCRWGRRTFRWRRRPSRTGRGTRAARSRCGRTCRRACERNRRRCIAGIMRTWRQSISAWSGC
jgi:arylsulfatase A-like enzyme